MSTYQLTNTTYTETIGFALFNDPDNPDSPSYTLSGATQTVPVTRNGRAVSYKLPFDLPTIEVEGDRLVASVPGAFVDHWEKVR